MQHIVDLATKLPPTIRSLLKIAAKVFDPLGHLTLFTIDLRILFQDLCVAKIPWDKELEGSATIS